MKTKDIKVYFVDCYHCDGDEVSYDICRGIYHKGTRNSFSYYDSIKNLTTGNNYYSTIHSSGRESYIYCNQPNALKRIKEIRNKMIKMRIKELQKQIKQYEIMIGIKEEEI